MYFKSTKVLLLILTSFVLINGQTVLQFKKDKIVLGHWFSPLKPTDAEFYRVNLRRSDVIRINVDSNSVTLAKGNDCSVFFELFDPAGKQVPIGESPIGNDTWRGEIVETGAYKVRLYVGCIEAYTADELRKKRPKFSYVLSVLRLSK